jgi:hypothetical protein
MSWNLSVHDNCDADDELTDEEMISISENLETLKTYKFYNHVKVQSSSNLARNNLETNFLSSSLNESTCTFQTDGSACSFTEEEIFSFGGDLSINLNEIVEENEEGAYDISTHQREDFFFGSSRRIQRSPPIAIPFVGRS